MYDFTIINIHTGERECVIGFDFKEACEAFGLNYKDYKVMIQVYID